jgi:arsenate reductase
MWRCRDKYLQKGCNMILYGLKTCDTCRKAKAETGVEITDIRETPVPQKVLDRALEKFGDALVNRRSTTWRGLSEEARAHPPLALLQEHPALMKRPLVVDGERLTLGWGTGKLG